MVSKFFYYPPDSRMSNSKKEFQDDFHGKLTDVKNLMTGLLEIMEKTFDAMFELQWAIVGAEVEKTLVIKPTNKKPIKETKTKPIKATKKNKMIQLSHIQLPEVSIDDIDSE